MTQPYVTQLKALIERVDPTWPPNATIEVKHFFGGAAAFVEGRIFMSLTKVGLALKLPQRVRLKLFESGNASELRYFSKSPVKKQYALMSDQYVHEAKPAKLWIETSAAYVVTLEEQP